MEKLFYTSTLCGGKTEVIFLFESILQNKFSRPTLLFSLNYFFVFQSVGISPGLHIPE